MHEEALRWYSTDSVVTFEEVVTAIEEFANREGSEQDICIFTAFGVFHDPGIDKVFVDFRDCFVGEHAVFVGSASIYELRNMCDSAHEKMMLEGVIEILRQKKNVVHFLD